MRWRPYDAAQIQVYEYASENILRANEHVNVGAAGLVLVLVLLPLPSAGAAETMM